MTEKNKSAIHQILDYRVIAEIGRGAASVIYAVNDPKGYVYALKHVILKGNKDDRFLEQAENEVKISAKLDHPAIRKIHKLHKIRPGLARTEVAVLMELLDADALDILKIDNLGQLVNIFHQVAEGLAHMNDKGFVHADMKPTNVLVDENFNAKVIDLGQACKVGTVKTRIQGTPGYMAPEQANRKEITERTDVYNFGATMYWLLTGQQIPTARPDATIDDGSSSGYVLGASGGKSAQLPPDPREFNSRVPEELAEIVMRSVQVNQHARYKNMHSVLERLQAVLVLLQADSPNT